MPVSVPFVSVVMPVRNAMPYLHDSIRSILEQTHRELELVVLDDASTDGSREALREWARRESRIRLFEGERCLGPAESSNFVVRQATSPIVARMDADDVSHPDRLRRQLAVLARHPEVVLVGSLWEGIDPRSRRVRGRDRSRLARPSPFPPFQHGSVVFRREVFDRVGGYRAACAHWEDLDLFFRFAGAGHVAVLADVLYSYRFSAASSRLTTDEDEVERAVELMFRCIEERGRGRSYEPLIAAAAGANGRRDARAVSSIGSGRVWAGMPPRTFLRLLRHGTLRWDWSTATALGRALCATASPRLVRRVARTVVWMRDFRVRHRFADGTPCDWCWPPGDGRAGERSPRQLPGAAPRRTPATSSPNADTA
jgi:glycosyltransferase involved in cell wall biosynthesis